MRSNATIKQKCDGTANKTNQMTKILPLNAFKAEEDELMPVFGLALDWPIGVEPVDLTSASLSKQSRGDVYVRDHSSKWISWIEKPQLDSSWGRTGREPRLREIWMIQEKYQVD